MKKAIITGITGQDGPYLAKFLLKNGYEVFGTYRQNSCSSFWRLKELGIHNNEKLSLVEFDLTDLGSAINMISTIEPNEIYNLAAQSFVGVSFKQPFSTSMITGLGATNILESIRIVNKNIKFYQASTSEMFGKVQEVPQTEDTPFYPRSPYGVAKLYAHWMTVNYRESYDMFCSSGILFNHESPLRGKEFVTRKITDAVSKIKLGKLDYLEIGNLDAERDWGYAKDYVEGMYLMLQAPKPDTYVLATNRTESVRYFINMAFNAVDIEIEFSGNNENEVGKCAKTGKTLVKVNKEFYRPAEVELLVGNSAKAYKDLGWQSNTSLENLCRIMVEADLVRNSNG